MTNFRNKQQGVVLMIALIALVAISLAGIALMRSVDTSNVVSGNIAFNETAIQMADIGAELAYSEILGDTAGNPASCQNNAANCPLNTAGKSYLFPNVSVIDPKTNLPTPAGGIVWSDPSAQTLAGEATPSYSVHYVIERMCGKEITGIVADNTLNNQEAATFAKCKVAPIYDPNGMVVAGLGKLFYRITVEVTGPRNTRGLSQYFYGKPDSIN